MNKTLLLFLLLLFPQVSSAGPLGFKGSFTLDSGKQISLSEWKGKRVVLAMLYPRCTSACPFVLQKLKEIQKKLEEKGEKAEFVLISFDTENESSARLKEYREHLGLTRENWHFLWGKDRDVRTFSNLVNIRFWRNPKSNDISHDNVIILINEKGEIVRRLEGLDAKLAELF